MGKCKKISKCPRLVSVNTFVRDCIKGVYHESLCDSFSYPSGTELQLPKDWIIREDPCGEGKCEIGCSPYDLRHSADPHGEFRCPTKLAFDRWRESQLRYRVLWKLQGAHKRLRDAFDVLRGKKSAWL